MGIIQATEALKYLLDSGKLLIDQLLFYDAAEMTFNKIKTERNPRCPICGESPSITALQDEAQSACPMKGEGSNESA